MSERADIEPRVVTPGTFSVLKADQFVGKVKFQGANAIGPHITMELLNVTFRPANNAMGMIQDEWGQLQVTGEVLVDATGIFSRCRMPLIETLATCLCLSLFQILRCLRIIAAGSVSEAKIWR
jgi:hypothetical protein